MRGQRKLAGRRKSIHWPARPACCGQCWACGVRGKKWRWGWDRQALEAHAEVSAFYPRATRHRGRILGRGGLPFRKVSPVTEGVEDGPEEWAAAVGTRKRCQALPEDAAVAAA